MPLRSVFVSQRALIFVVVFVLAGGFLATSLLGYMTARSSIREGIVNTELPLTADTVYSEIQKDLVRPTVISSMMSGDTFLRDWAVAGEKSPEQLTRYLNQVMTSYGAYTAFFVSNSSLIYYQAKGILKTLQANDPRDRWYYRVRNMTTPYEINVDVDMANHDDLTFFINYKVYDYDNKFIGVAGVGLRANAIIQLIDTYQQRYDRRIYFVDKTGRLTLTGSNGGPEGARAGERLADLASTRELRTALPQPAEGSYEYVAQGQGHFLDVRFIPELNWYLYTDKREDKALSDIRSSLYANLLICLLITLAVMVLLSQVVRRYQQHIEALATIDTLTGLPNRRGFDLLAAQTLREALRDRQPLAALMFDLDHFKRLNDTRGHLAGDLVLQGFAKVLQDALRKADIVCRWGGEEFIVLLKSDSEGARRVAEKVLMQTEHRHYNYEGHSISVTVSVGMTSVQNDDTLQLLISRADKALYRAKETGRNRLCVDTEHSPDE